MKDDNGDITIEVLKKYNDELKDLLTQIQFVFPQKNRPGHFKDIPAALSSWMEEKQREISSAIKLRDEANERFDDLRLRFEGVEAVHSQSIFKVEDVRSCILDRKYYGVLSDVLESVIGAFENRRIIIEPVEVRDDKSNNS